MSRTATAALAILLAGCAAMTPGPTETEPSGNVEGGSWLLPGTEWRLVELGGAPFPARAVATLTEDGRIVGQAPCNRFTASYSGRWPDLSFTPLASTRMACPDLTAEGAFFAALGAVDRAAIDEGGLTLTGPDGVELRFVRL